MSISLLFFSKPVLLHIPARSQRMCSRSPAYALATGLLMGKHKSAKTVLPPTARSLPIALARAREKVMAPIRDMLSESGITEQQWRVLRVLSESGDLDATKLADRACLLLPSLTRIVQTMLDKGYVTRNTDEDDRRRQSIAITDKGQAIIDANIQQASAISSRYISVLGKERYEELLDSLQALDELAS
jgi:homoprotocatechuate degradation regulator HpaR